jgi:hypothetical protein
VARCAEIAGAVALLALMVLIVFLHWVLRIPDRYGAGNPYDPNSINNRYGQYGSRFSNQSANNPYATNAPKLFDDEGNYRGRLSSNPYDPDSVSNSYGHYGRPLFSRQRQ